MKTKPKSHHPLLSTIILTKMQDHPRGALIELTASADFTERENAEWTKNSEP